MTEFLYLYRRNPNALAALSPEQSQQTMQRWMAWLKDLAQKGHIKDQGQPLEGAGKLVSGKQKTVTDAPFAEAKDVIGGYTLVLARDLDQAAELSKGCPVLDFDGGAVEVRPIMKMSM